MTANDSNSSTHLPHAETSAAPENLGSSPVGMSEQCCDVFAATDQQMSSL